ncbi:MAG: ABC transporter substrate-binding protein, partial [Nocardioidaceae bacterium]|nr:ABC transporter substrate-binding protein [Nocardioidaceae bacterium]
MTRNNRSSIRASRGAIAVVAVAGLALTGCGREPASTDDGPGQGAAVSEGEATGTVDVWAMGTEGEMLGDFVADFEDANPEADVKVTAVP